VGLFGIKDCFIFVAKRFVMQNDHFFLNELVKLLFLPFGRNIFQGDSKDEKIVFQKYLNIGAILSLSG
jgi:hypothetical protein